MSYGVYEIRTSATETHEAGDIFEIEIKVMPQTVLLTEKSKGIAGYDSISGLSAAYYTVVKYGAYYLPVDKNGYVQSINANSTKIKALYYSQPLATNKLTGVFNGLLYEVDQVLNVYTTTNDQGIDNTNFQYKFRDETLRITVNSTAVEVVLGANASLDSLPKKVLEVANTDKLDYIITTNGTKKILNFISEDVNMTITIKAVNPNMASTVDSYIGRTFGFVSYIPQ